MAIVRINSLALFVVLASLTCALAQVPGPLRISDNHRFLVYEDGTPFFWQADTAWELFHRCDREEVEYYLQKRLTQGFNVIQAVALAEIDGLETPNPYEQRPLIENDPARPNEKYFEHVDFVIDRANDLGMYIALLPTWGDKVFRHNWGVGPEVFTPENARTFGEWIGRRYQNRKNIIWVIGGDRNPRPDTEDVAIWRQLAEGVASGVGGHDQALMTFHPQPTSPGGSSNWFHQDEWLDFNMHQTGHCANRGTYKLIQHDYHLSPTKPVIDGEPLYEDHPNCFNAKELGYSLPADIRRIMYWDVFAGAFGQTYGCHAVWQMFTNDRDPINGPLRPWKVALDLPMANQVRHLKNLMLSRPFLSRIPDQSMIPDLQPEDEHYSIATRDSEGTYAMVYFPTGKPAEINLVPLRAKKLMVWWFDPRTGNAINAGKMRHRDRKLFTPPSAGAGHDWVLVLDASNRGYVAPGQAVKED